MVIEKLREHAKREAEAKWAEDQAKAGKRSRRRKSVKKFLPLDIIQHPIFLPAIGVWGAVMAGIGVLMLSAVTIARLTLSSGLSFLGEAAQPVFAAIAAIAVGAVFVVIGFLIRKLTARKGRRGPIATMAARRVRPIDPASELGSDSLDAPIEEMPFSSDLDEEEFEEDYPLAVFEREEEPLELDASAEIGEDYADEDEQRSEFGQPELAVQARYTPEQAARELDLAEFAALPGRNAVWVNEDEGEPLDTVDLEPKRDAIAGLKPAKPDQTGRVTQSQDEQRTALEQLRQVPPQELSLVQMVERFAAALHEHQEATRSLANATKNAQADLGKDAALAEALKALSLFTERGFDAQDSAQTPQQPANMVNETERELRNALAKLQNLRGAA